MIKVLLVEDDKLVRKSLITSFDWNKFNMNIVGDAKNGEKALEFLENNEVNLIITDLAMPIMSGIELIKRVKELYPSIFIVVLSLHRDFEYIQKAMRLGAIDYIAKVELDSENMDKTLDRIHESILNNEKKPFSNTISETDIINGAILLSDISIEGFMKDLKNIIHENNWMYIGLEAALMITDNSDKFLEIKQLLRDQASDAELLLLIKIENNTNWQLNDIKKFIQGYRERLYFYEIKKDEKVTSIHLEDVVLSKPLKDQGKIDQIKVQLKSLEWVFDHQVLEKMLKELKKLRLTRHKINELLIITLTECNRLHSTVMPNIMNLPESFATWQDIEDWFWDTKEIIYDSVTHRSVSKETNQSIMEAIYHIGENLSSDITATDISKKVHMSRSYFSICFKQVVGETFNQYLRIARMKEAMNYLIYTTEKIAIIAEKVGYLDVTYFRKVFRSQTGYLPSQYRERYKKL